MKEPSTYELSLFLEIDENIISSVLLATLESDSLDRVICEDGKELLLLDTVKDEKDEYNIDNIFLKEEIELLPEPEKTIIKESYFSDKTQDEIAQKLGMYQVEVCRFKQKGLKKLKNSMQKVA